jgi:hypothetical protein
VKYAKFAANHIAVGGGSRSQLCYRKPQERHAWKSKPDTPTRRSIMEAHSEQALARCWHSPPLRSIGSYPNAQLSNFAWRTGFEAAAVQPRASARQCEARGCAPGAPVCRSATVTFFDDLVSFCVATNCYRLYPCRIRLCPSESALYAVLLRLFTRLSCGQ